LTDIQMFDVHGHSQNRSDALRERFVLDEKRDVIDKLNSIGRKGYCHEGSPEDQFHLRERVLMVRLGELVDALIINLEPEQTDRWGNTYQPFNKERHAIWLAIYYAITASRLNALEPAVSIQNRFDGTLKRRKIGLQEFTSLSLFRDDVERLLRDLYGDIKDDALDKVLSAIFVIVQEFTQYVRKDLWQEDQDATDWDYIWGIGLPEGCGISGSDHRRAMKAVDELRIRAREVRKNPSAFSKYTVEFATRHIGEFINLDERENGAEICF
jgi:hypothetical protein